MFVVPLSAAKRGGTIECRELATYPEGAVYKVQPKAWFSKDIMLEWVEEVLAPYIAMAPPGIVPLLFLDSFRVHMIRGGVHPARMHRPSTARRRGLQQGLRGEG
jgi:hypothetical protein